VAGKAVTQEEFQGEWTTPVPESTTTQPEVADWSQGVQVLLCLCTCCLLKTRGPDLPLRAGLPGH
jgi:hypothetical protein